MPNALLFAVSVNTHGHIARNFGNGKTKNIANCIMNWAIWNARILFSCSTKFGFARSCSDKGQLSCCGLIPVSTGLQGKVSLGEMQVPKLPLIHI